MHATRGPRSICCVGLVLLGVLGCDGAEVGRCGTDGELVAAGAERFCVYAGEGAERLRCPESFPVRVVLPSGVVCAQTETTPAELPSDVCDALPEGCGVDDDAGVVDAGAPDTDAPDADAGSGDADTPIPIDLAWRGASGVEPDPRTTASMTFDGTGRALMAGGLSAAMEELDEVWAFHFGDESWERVGMPQPTRVQGPLVAVVAGGARLLVAGGYESTSMTAIDAGWLLDLETGAWTETEALPAAMSFTCVASGPSGDVYSFGGGRAFGSFASEFWLLDGGALTWSDVVEAGTRPTRREGGACAIHDGAFYAIGGHAETGLPEAHRFDLGTATWEPLPIDLSGHGVSHHAIGFDPECGALLLAGGYDGALDGVVAVVLGDEPRVARIGTLPQPRANAVGAFDPETRTFVVFGGDDGTGAAVYADTLVADVPACP